ADAPWTIIAVSNRQKASGIGYDRDHADLCRFRLDLAYAVATNTADRLVADLEQELAAVEPHAPSAPGVGGPGAVPPPPPPPLPTVET
ncbi:MAG TPA: hypothetical protein VGI86_04955, partial [Acidimicrobiia bacterium]